jgi:hypothetical protein
VLLLLHDMKRIVELAELVMDQRVGGEAVFGQPGSVEPVSMKSPFKKAGLDDRDEEGDGYPCNVFQ